MKVLVATSMWPTPENPAFGSFVKTQIRSLQAAGVDVEPFVLSGRSRKAMYLKAVFQLRRRLARDPVDLIHAHYGFVGIVARTQWKVPVVVTFHGDDALGSVNERGKQLAWSRLVAWSSRMLARRVDASIIQNQPMAAKLDAPNVYILPHEVDLDLFRPHDREEARAALELRPDGKYLLFAAPPHVIVKRYPFAKEVADELARRDPSVELLVAHRETQDRLALYMSACDALLFPSFQEGSPNIIKQAMACNLPIVATDVGDVTEVIGGTDGCYVCEPDVDVWVNRLEQILARRERTTGRSEVRRFEPAAVAARLVDLYEQVLTARRSAAPEPGVEPA